MTKPEIDAEGLAKAAEAIDTLWSEGQDRGPSFSDTEREYQEHCRSTARAAIAAYLAAVRTSEAAEPVAVINEQGGVLLTEYGAEWFRAAVKTLRHDLPGKPVLRLYAVPHPSPVSEEVTDYFGNLVGRARTAAAKASVKFPQPNYVTLKIAEEAGEVVRGAVHYAENRMEWSEVEGEIVQLLAMLIRFVTEGDQINGITPPAALASLRSPKP